VKEDPVSVTLKAPAAKVGTTHKSDPQVVETVAAVLEDIRTNGDSAVRKYSEKFDKWSPESFRLSHDQVGKIVSDLSSTVIDDLTFVQKQVRNFAQAQRDSMLDVEIETLPGVRLGHKHLPVWAYRA
jgi:sulfopropanediol 3-dehydrogenase